MIYRIEIGKTADKKIGNLKDRILKKNIKSKIRSLKNNPKKGKYLFKNFYELKAKNYRIYYAIFKGIIVIEDVEYDGKIVVRDVGTKNTQTRDLKSLQ